MRRRITIGRIFWGVVPLLFGSGSLHAALWPSENLVENPGFELREGTQIKGWFPSGGAAGKERCSTEANIGVNGTSGLKIEPSQGALVLRCSNVELPEDARKVDFCIQAKLLGQGSASLAIHWFSAGGKISSSEGRASKGPCDWTSLSVTGKVPRGAVRAHGTAKFQALSKEAFVDNASIVALTKSPPPLKVLCNQVGYDEGLPVKALVQFIGDPVGQGSFRVVNDSGKVIRQGALTYQGSVQEWNRAYAMACVAGLLPGDGYRVEAAAGKLEGVSPPFSVGKDALQKKTLGPAAGFYYYQRCGCAVPGWHEACHMDDAKLPDGTHKDCTGGWHDAGDYNKYNGYTPLSVYALAYAYERQQALLDAHTKAAGIPSSLEEACWGANWLLKMEHEKTGKLWHMVRVGHGRVSPYWGPPEAETDNVPGNQDDRPIQGGLRTHDTVSAALALVGRLTGNKAYVEAGERFYEAIPQESIKGAGGTAMALISSLELEKALSSPAYGDRAKSLAEALLQHQIQSGPFQGGFANIVGEKTPFCGVTALGQPAAALALYAQSHQDDMGIRQALVHYLAFSQALADNPFQISKMVQGSQAVFFMRVNGPGFLGQNSMYLSQAWALINAWKVTKEDAFLDLAMRQIDWVLGRNPLQLCMMEGQGAMNPHKYHHRYDTIKGHERGAVPGAVCNGIVRQDTNLDIPWFDMKSEVMPTWQSNEPWLPHNAMYLLAVSSL